MGTQWHPVLAELLKLLFANFYEIQTEVPVSELPRRSDILVVRRQGGPPPPFVGIWAHLTDWNVFEFKGPTDAPEEDDLELLVHVGTGITYKLNEERRSRSEERIANRQVSFWYLTPTLGDTFLGHARLRTSFMLEAPGLWYGKVWGHTVWLLGYRDAAVEVDSLPLHILRREPIPSRPFAELLVSNEELLRRFASWVFTFQPGVWEEIQHMATTSTKIQLDWKEIGKHVDLREIVRTLPPDDVVQILGQSKVIEALGPEKVLDELLARIPAEQLEEMLRRRQQQGQSPAGE